MLDILLKKLVPGEGIEPPTQGFSVRIKISGGGGTESYLLVFIGNSGLLTFIVQPGFAPFFHFNYTITIQCSGKVFR